MRALNWCMCWRTNWEYEHMSDDRGHCKHCGKKIQHFFIKKVSI